MRDLVDLRAFWLEHKTDELVLCTIVHKAGSSYRSVGAKKLIASDGSSCGLLSGGCLESEIEETAARRRGDLPFIQSFSTAGEDDTVIGYQAGCAGIIDILFQTVSTASDDVDILFPFGSEKKAHGVLVDLSADNLGHRRFINESEGNRKRDVFFEPWTSPLVFTVVGGGLDAAPFSLLVSVLGWSLRFLDYRAAMKKNFQMPSALEIRPLVEIVDAMTLGPRAAVLLMTHNYNADSYLFSELVDRRLGYLGCLGPRARYNQMRNDFELKAGRKISPEWEKCVHAPAGIYTRESAPEGIALSIVAQVHHLLAHLSR